MDSRRYFALQALALLAGLAVAWPCGNAAGMVVWFGLGLLIDRRRARRA